MYIQIKFILSTSSTIRLLWVAPSPSLSSGRPSSMFSWVCLPCGSSSCASRLADYRNKLGEATDGLRAGREEA